MINLETRKKLKKLNLFKNVCDCPYEEDGGCDEVGCPVGDERDGNCYYCEIYLPDPTLEELIEAVDEKRSGSWSMEYQAERDGWLVWFQLKPFNEYIRSKDLKQALAQDLIWLYEEEA